MLPVVHPALVISLTSATVVVSLVLGVLGFVLTAHLRYRKSQPAAYSGATLIRYWLREAWAHLRLMGLIVTRFFASNDDGFQSATRSTTSKSGRPVVLVHGFIGNHSNWWPLRKALHQRGRPTIAANLGRPPQKIESYVPGFLEALERAVHRSEDGRVDIVAHSMGSLVLRLSMEQYDGVTERLGQVITLGAPYQGTPSVPEFMTHEAKQMRPGSDFLEELPALSEDLKRRWTTAAARQDYIVYPESTSRIDGVEHHTVDEVGHAGLLLNARVHEVIFSVLDRDAA